MENGQLTAKRQRVRSLHKQKGYGLWLQRAGIVAVALMAFWWTVGEDWAASYRQYAMRAELAEQFAFGLDGGFDDAGFADVPSFDFAGLDAPDVVDAADDPDADPVTGVVDDPRIETPEANVAVLPTEDTSAAADPDGSHARPIGRIQIPSIDLDWAVAKGVAIADLRSGPGWMPGTAALGAPGNSVLSGHRTTYGAPFNRLDELDLGDHIVVSVPGRADAVYEVRDVFIVAPTEVGVAASTSGSRLTLTTCHPKGSARERLIVQAEQVAGPGAAAAVARDDHRRYNGDVIERFVG